MIPELCILIRLHCAAGPSTMKAALILNPIAGQGKPAANRDRLEKLCRSHGIDVEVMETATAGHGTELAKTAIENGHDLIIAAGGDGTVNEVVNGINGTSARLGIIPVGTVNVLARELRIPLKADKAARIIVQGHTKAIDIGRANGRLFTLMAGFGFDGEVVANVLQPLKDVIGSSAYVLEALGALARYQATEFTLEMPDEIFTTRAFLVIVANSSTYTYRLKIAPYAEPDDGLFDVIVFERPLTDRVGFLRQILEVFITRHMHHKAVRYFKTSKITVRSNPDVMVQVDGDSMGTTPVEIEVIPRAIQVIVP